MLLGPSTIFEGWGVFRLIFCIRFHNQLPSHRSSHGRTRERAGLDDKLQLGIRHQQPLTAGPVENVRLR